MNVLSLFDGMSCTQIALNNLGFKNINYYASEIDKYGIKVTQSNYPKTIQLGDVRNVKKSNLPEIDLLSAGSPCQGFSFAGKGLNFQDERSKLFFEFLRILKEVKPKYFLLENVKMKKEFSDKISELLKCQPIEINSNLVSAQNRKRLYWTNIPNVKQPKDKCIKFCSITEGDRVTIKEKSQTILATIYKENAKSMLKRKKYGLLVYSDSQKINLRKVTPLECERLQTVPDNYTNFVSNTQRYKMLGNGFTVKVIEHILQNIQ